MKKLVALMSAGFILLIFTVPSFAFIRTPEYIREKIFKAPLYLDVDIDKLVEEQPCRNITELPWDLGKEKKEYPLYVTATWLKFNPSRGEHWEDLYLTHGLFLDDIWQQQTRTGLKIGTAYQERTYKINKPGEYFIRLGLFAIDGRLMKIIKWHIKTN